MMKATMKAYDPATTTWEIRAADFPWQGKLSAQAKFLLGYAILAPSSHNTQPWKFRVSADGGIDVCLDYDGWLRVADADQRELHLSIGCALENLLIAGHHFGCAPTVEYFPEPENPALVARVRLSASRTQPEGLEPIFAAITLRHTHHKPFASRPLPPEVMQRVTGSCNEPGINLFLTIDETIRRQMDELIVRSDAVTFANPAWREELAYWIGQGVFGTPWLISQLGRLATAYVNLSKPTQRSDHEVLMSAPILALLAATNDDRVAQIKAGQIFERIYLICAAEGIGVRPMSQICQVPEHKAQLKALLPAGDFPLQPFLLGYTNAEATHTPRKPVTEVLL